MEEDEIINAQRITFLYSLYDISNSVI
jgi:hypothetical protein